MRWVDVKSYVGLDRRNGRKLWIFDRRDKKAAGGIPPSLSTALRQLRLRSLDIEDAEGLTAFCERANATALLAIEYEAKQVAEKLRELVERLEGQADFALAMEEVERVMPDIEAAA